MFQLKKVGLDYFKVGNTFSTTVEINASVEEVFALLKKPETWVAAFDGIQELTWTSPEPFGVSTTRTVVIEMPPLGKVTLYEEYVLWEENKRFSFYFKETDKKVFSAVIEDYHFEHLEHGRMRLTQHFAYQGAGLFRPLLWLIKGTVQKENQASLDSLKSYIESQK